MTPEEALAIERVVVTFSCSCCGAEGYEIELTGAEIESVSEVSLPCDECSCRIAVDVDVRVQTRKQAAPKAGERR